MIAVGLIAAASVAAAVLFYLWLTPKGDRSNDADFDRAAAESSGSEKWLIGLSRSLSGLEFTNPPEESPAYRSLRAKLIASGNMFGGSVNVFLSVQMASIVIGILIALFAFLSGLNGVVLGAAALFAFAVAYWPWQKVSSAAKKNAEKVDSNLPDFCELLLMPLTSGYGILPALSFTADRVPGPVAREVNVMLQAIQSRAVGEEEAFEEAGLRLGTPAARALFNAIAQSQRDGTPAAEIISGQAKQLRKVSYERVRAKIKVLPNKVVLIMGMHLLPTLFILLLVPIFFQISTGMSR